MDGFSALVANGAADNASFSLVLIYSTSSLPIRDLELADGVVTLSSSSDVVTISGLDVDSKVDGSIAWYTLDGVVFA